MFWFLILLAIAAFLFWVSRKPGEFTLERSTLINASPAQIHPWINNLKQMNQWNPWATYDPKSKITYEGPEAGPGAVYTWGGSRMGEGRFKITDTKADAISADLTMIKPMKADNKVIFALQPEGTATRVTWRMSGCNGFLQKLMHTFMNMDKMVGTEFEKGLAGLKQRVEARAIG
jgi:hypothetical protein